MDNQQVILTIFVAVTSIAVVLQMAILFALYMSVKKTSARVEALSVKMEAETLPALAQARELLTEVKPKITTIVDNLTETTTLVREQSQRIGLTLNDALDRTRLQVIRADEMVTRTLDRVEETTDMVQHTVLSPVRKVSALMDGFLAGFGSLRASKKVTRHEKEVRREEMFI